MTAPLTTRQTQILDFLRTSIEEKGYPPSLREVGDAVGLTTGSVHNQLVTLQAKGYIVRDPGRPRALTLVDHNPTATPACTCDLAEKILELHKPWYEINGVRHNQYVTVMADEVPEGHVCIEIGFDRCQVEPDAPEDSEHSIPACVECRPNTVDGLAGHLFWPCPTALLAGAAP